MKTLAHLSATSSGNDPNGKSVAEYFLSVGLVARIGQHLDDTAGEGD
ncbi:MAG: hypothetical protein OXH68_21920 [Gammaproteobacteria bacterium]|nr:hypothetical protein [Gammaproteobacteria bacterium]